MDRYERVMAALMREKPDVPPICLWAHVGALPFLDLDYEATCRRGEDLADAHLAFFNRFGIDLVKVTPFASNICISWGSKYKWNPHDEWVALVDRAVKNEEDWHNLRALDPRKATVAQDLKAAKILKQRLGEETPYVWTIMGALYTACALGGDELVLSGIKSGSEALKNALEIISETLIRFGQECLDVGSTGIFYSTRAGAEHCMWDKLTRTQLEEFSFKYDLKILRELKDADIRILHICTGHNREDKPRILTDLLESGYFAAYPVNAINWWDKNFFDLQKAKQAYGKRFCLLGGLDQEHTLPHGSIDEVTAEAKDAINTAGSLGGFVVAPGCTIRANTPEQNFAAAVKATRT